MTQSGLEKQEVMSVENIQDAGYWAPLTTEGTLLVNGFMASCYASYPHTVSDMALSVVKMMPRMLLDDSESQHKDGVRKVVSVLKDLGTRIGLRRTRQPGVEGDGVALKQPFCCTATGQANMEMSNDKFEL